MKLSKLAHLKSSWRQHGDRWVGRFFDRVAMIELIDNLYAVFTYHQKSTGGWRGCYVADRKTLEKAKSQAVKAIVIGHDRDVFDA